MRKHDLLMSPGWATLLPNWPHVDVDGKPRCLLLDPKRLRRSGAVAIRMTADGPQVTTGQPMRLSR